MSPKSNLPVVVRSAVIERSGARATFRVVNPDPGRIVALVPLDAAVGLLERGWEVDDLHDQAGVARWSASLPEAKKVCERDLPRGTAVNWTQGAVFGGFVSGYPDAGPEVGGPAPAFVLWPDGSESRAESVGELAELMRGRMRWLAQMSSTAGFSEAEISEATSRHAGCARPVGSDGGA